VFLATPARGAPVAAVAEWLSMNPQIRDMEPAAFNTFLQTLENQWLRMMIDRERSREFYPQAFCAYEKLPYGVLTVVPDLYSTSRCDNVPIAMDYNHVDIVKPAGPDVRYPYLWTKARFDEADSLIASASLAASSLNPSALPRTSDPSLDARHASALGDGYSKIAVTAKDPGEVDQARRAALQAYTLAASLVPGNSMYTFKVGETLNSLKRFTEATSRLQRAVDLDPTIAWYRNELCANLTQTGRLVVAKPECSAAVELEPDNEQYRIQWQRYNEMIAVAPNRGAGRVGRGVM
jgi:tetratricopeptide (TPR) repeat protein